MDAKTFFTKQLSFIGKIISYLPSNGEPHIQNTKTPHHVRKTLYPTSQAQALGRQNLFNWFLVYFDIKVLLKRNFCILFYLLNLNQTAV